MMLTIPELEYAGIDYTGKTDCTKELQKLLDNYTKSRCVTLPALKYRTSMLKLSTSLVMEPGGILYDNRFSIDVPLIQFRDRECTLANVRIASTLHTKNGYVLLGPLPGENFTVFDCRVENCIIEGVSSKVSGFDSTGILFTSPQATNPSAKGATYANKVTNCTFKGMDVGVQLNPICNLNQVINPLFYSIQDGYCIKMINCTENTVVGGAVHLSKGTTVFYLEDCGYCHGYGMQAETGVGGKMMKSVGNNIACQFIWHDNTGGGFPELTGDGWLIIQTGIVYATDFVKLSLKK